MPIRFFHFFYTYVRSRRLPHVKNLPFQIYIVLYCLNSFIAFSISGARNKPYEFLDWAELTKENGMGTFEAIGLVFAVLTIFHILCYCISVIKFWIADLIEKKFGITAWTIKNWKTVEKIIYARQSCKAPAFWIFRNQGGFLSVEYSDCRDWLNLESVQKLSLGSAGLAPLSIQKSLKTRYSENLCFSQKRSYDSTRARENAQMYSHAVQTSWQRVGCLFFGAKSVSKRFASKT